MKYTNPPGSFCQDELGKYSSVLSAIGGGEGRAWEGRGEEWKGGDFGSFVLMASLQVLDLF